MAMGENARKLDAYDRTVMISSEKTGSASINDPWIGTLLAETYRIEKVLGEGGMGLVYEASHVRIDRRYAIKVIHMPLAQREDMRSRFEREARVMSRVKSDHVVDVADVVLSSDGRTCIVTELLEGLDLEQYLDASGSKLALAEAVSLCRQNRRGLSPAHALGVVHRDLKPSNLFLARDSSGKVTLKILDFGVAKMSGDSELTATGVVVGTPAYMAPEQARGASFADARSDVYAAGAVLYRMLTSKAPFEGEDATATLIKLMQESPERPTAIERTIPAGLEAVIEKAMARDPKARFQSVDELDRALLPFDSGGVAGLPTSGTKPGAGPASVEARALSRRARMVRPLGVLSGAAAVLGAGGSMAAALSLLVGALSKTPGLSTTELVLVVLGGLVAAGTTGVGVKRALEPAWRNAPMVQVETERFTRSLLVGACTLGVLELFTILHRAFIQHSLDADSPVWAAIRVGLSLAASTFVFLRGKSK
jgi:tRNA A-37 threonylcarbamoyl transferase component Bud32